MTQVCAPKGCFFLARFFAIDQCTFAPVPGASNGYAVECFRNTEAVPNVTEGNTVTLTNECGKSCWKTLVCDKTEGYDISIEMLQPDYELYGLLTSNPLITDPLDPTKTVGTKTLEENDCKPLVGLELFSRVPAGACDDTGIEVRREIYVARFGEPSEAAETDNDQVTFRTLTYTASTLPYQPAAYGEGPFQDSWLDFTGDEDNVHRIEFDDTIDPDTLSGTCGTIEVPALVP